MSDLGAVGEPAHRCDHLFSEITCASRKREHQAQWRKIMGKTNMRNFDARREIREPRDELSEAELGTVSGGKVMHGDLQVQKYLDKASIILF
jgi:type VI protein secretion system component Hcp